MDIDFFRSYARAAHVARGPAWRYNEMRPCGADFNNVFLASRYDGFHQKFRDYGREARRIVAALGLDHTATVLDMGCGTGAFAIPAAQHYRRIHAVDVAGAMLRRARRKARTAGLTNIEFHRGGFLTYEHAGAPVDALVSVLALHHLPDFWKLVGLYRQASALRAGGRLYLFDVVFSFDAARSESSLARYVQGTGLDLGPGGRAALETHVREEYSTCGWIMEGLLERAGFRIDQADYQNDFLAAYVCTRRPEAATLKEPQTSQEK
jgi:putative AdoMet-dependent methyltransferase